MLDTQRLRVPCRHLPQGCRSADRNLQPVPAWVENPSPRHEGQEDRDLLHRRHPLREGHQLHAPRRFRKGLSPEGRHPEIPRGDSTGAKPVDGACYVFDERVAVGHGLQQADFTTCHVASCLSRRKSAFHPNTRKASAARPAQTRSAKTRRPRTANASANSSSQGSAAPNTSDLWRADVSLSTLGTNDLARSKRFYDPVLKELGMVCSAGERHRNRLWARLSEARRARPLLLSHQALPQLPCHVGQRHAGGLQGRVARGGECLPRRGTREWRTG